MPKNQYWGGADNSEIFVNFDWPEFENSDQSMVVLGMQTAHSRSTPHVWKTVRRPLLGEIGFAYLIRFRGVITVESADGQVRKGREWVGAGGRMAVIKDAKVTARREPVPLVTCVNTTTAVQDLQ